MNVSSRGGISSAEEEEGGIILLGIETNTVV
jgi:hypothetical protein